MVGSCGTRSGRRRVVLGSRSGRATASSVERSGASSMATGGRRPVGRESTKRARGAERSIHHRADRRGERAERLLDQPPSRARGVAGERRSATASRLPPPSCIGAAWWRRAQRLPLVFRGINSEVRSRGYLRYELPFVGSASCACGSPCAHGAVPRYAVRGQEWAITHTPASRPLHPRQ